MALGGEELKELKEVARVIKSESTRRIVEVHERDLNGAFLMPVG